MNTKLNRCLLTRAEVDEATQWLKERNLIPHGLSCKNPDIAFVCANIGDGDICDLGADGSWVLQNAVKMGLKGEKHGIDLIIPKDAVYEGFEMIEGDLMNTPYPDGKFDYVTCMSVIEHSVDFKLFAKECARILKPGGKLIVSADYFNPKPDTSEMKLYNLSWNVLGPDEVISLISELHNVGIETTSDIDLMVQEAVINPKFCSPANVSYTFIYLEFVKK